MRRSVTWTGSLAVIFGFAFAVEAYAEDDTSEPEGRDASRALVEDRDGDGVPDAEDNCPDVPNADQADDERDGVGNVCDNCLWAHNPSQFDCDDDFCGNLCDCDYNQNGICDFIDFGSFILAFGSDDECCDHSEPPDFTVGFLDFGFFLANFGSPPGPSGMTPGTVACPSSFWEP